MNGRVEYLLVSLWDSLDAVGAFAGDDVTGAVFYPEDEAYLVEQDRLANHYEVVEHRWPGHGSPVDASAGTLARALAWWWRGWLSFWSGTGDGEAGRV